eukprot:403354513
MSGVKKLVVADSTAEMNKLRVSLGEQQHNHQSQSQHQNTNEKNNFKIFMKSPPVLRSTTSNTQNQFLIRTFSSKNFNQPIKILDQQNTQDYTDTMDHLSKVQQQKQTLDQVLQQNTSKKTQRYHKQQQEQLRQRQFRVNSLALRSKVNIREQLINEQFNLAENVATSVPLSSDRNTVVSLHKELNNHFNTLQPHSSNNKGDGFQGKQLSLKSSHKEPQLLSMKKRLQSAQVTINRQSLMRNSDVDMIVQFTPFDHQIKPPKLDPPGNEEYKIVVLSNTKEKPIDDVHDYPLDLAPTYKINQKELLPPDVITSKIVVKVRGKFQKQIQAKENRSRTLKEINREIEDIGKDEQTLRRERIARALKATLQDMKKYNIQCGDDIYGILPSRAYEKADSKRFFNAIKMEKVTQVWLMLQEDKFLVHQYDHLHQYPLHFAAKRDNIELIKLLIHYKADVNCRDLNGRTPLFFAAIMNNVGAVSVLLSNMGNAFAMDKDGTKLEEVTANPEIIKMISKGKSFQVIMKFVPPGKRLDKFKEMGVDNFNKDNMSIDKNKSQFHRMKP